MWLSVAKWEFSVTTRRRRREYRPAMAPASKTTYVNLCDWDGNLVATSSINLATRYWVHSTWPCTRAVLASRRRMMQCHSHICAIHLRFFDVAGRSSRSLHLRLSVCHQSDQQRTMQVQLQQQIQLATAAPLTQRCWRWLMACHAGNIAAFSMCTHSNDQSNVNRNERCFLAFRFVCNLCTSF